MTRPEFTPGEGGGKPAKPKPLFPWLVPQPRPQPKPEPEVTSVTPMVNIVPKKPLTPAQQSSGKPRPATTGSSPVLVSPDILDINADAVGSLEQHIAALYDRHFILESTQLIDQTLAQVTSGYESTPLTEGQAQQVDYLLTEETDSLAREVLITLKRDGIPPRREWNDFMAQYALFSWDTESDAQAWATLATIAESAWDETTAFADEDHVEAVAQDLGDNAIEGLIVIDAETGDTLFDRTGVVRGDGSQYVGMQDTEADALRAEALSGRKLIFVHNHTEEIGASDEDRNSAFAAGAKLLIVITPQGQEFVYIRGKYGMVKVRDEKASYEVGPENPEETKELRLRSEAQTWAFQHDSPEYLFLQDGPGYIDLRAQGELKLYEDVEGILYGGESIVAYMHDKFGMVVLDQNPSHPYAVKIYAAGNEFWIDLRDDAVELTFKRIDTVPELHKQHRAQVSGQEYDNTSRDFLSALKEALEPQPIGIVTVSEILRLYTNEGLTPHVTAGVPTLSFGDQSIQLNVYEKSEQNPHAVLVDYFGQKFWVDTNDSDADFELHLFEDAVATDAPSGYEILPIVPYEIAHGGGIGYRSVRRRMGR